MKRKVKVLEFEQVEKLVYALDKGIFEIPYLNIKVGIDGIIGLIPVVGDTFTTTISLIVVGMLYTPEMGIWPLVRMLVNVLIDYGIGSVPLIGDMFDFYFQANLANLEIARPYYQS
jgi:hypothetical protein